MSFFDREPVLPPTTVQFFRRPNLVAFPITLGPDSVTLGLSDGQSGPGAFAVYIPAHETRVIPVARELHQLDFGRRTARRTAVVPTRNRQPNDRRRSTVRIGQIVNRSANQTKRMRRRHTERTARTCIRGRSAFMIAPGTGVPKTRRPEGCPRGVSSYPGVNIPVYDLDARLTAAQAALYFGLTPQAINRWHALGHLNTVGKNTRGHKTYVFSELLLAEKHTRRHINSSRNTRRRPAQRAAA